MNAPITGNVLAPATNILSIDDASSTDGTSLTVEINIQWTIGVISPETITGTQSFTLTTYSLWKEAELELNLTLQEVSDTVVFDVQQIASTDTTQETKELEYAWYSREYFFKQAQVAFEPVPFAATNGELTQTSDYLTGDEYPIEREEGVSYWGSSNDWSTNPAQFICSLWTIENERTTEDFNVAIYNSLDAGITDTVVGTCNYVACLNRVAHESFGDIEFPDQEIVRHEITLYTVHFDPITVSHADSIVIIYCLHTHIHVFERGSVAFASGVTEEVDESRLEELGISLNRDDILTPYLEIYSDDEDMYDAVFEIEFITTVEEETTWFNRTRSKITMQKPPCQVTLEELDNAASTVQVFTRDLDLSATKTIGEQ